MSYSNPAPFAALLLIADSIKASVEVLQKHPEGAQAFEAWMDQVDFDSRYSTRYKDLPVDAEVPETMVLAEDSFDIADDSGHLYVQSGYETFLWIDGEWVSEDDVDQDEDEEEEGDEENEEDPA